MTASEHVQQRELVRASELRVGGDRTERNQAYPLRRYPGAIVAEAVLRVALANTGEKRL